MTSLKLSKKQRYRRNRKQRRDAAERALSDKESFYAWIGSERAVVWKNLYFPNEFYERTGEYVHRFYEMFPGSCAELAEGEPFTFGNIHDPWFKVWEDNSDHHMGSCYEAYSNLYYLVYFCDHDRRFGKLTLQEKVHSLCVTYWCERKSTLSLVDYLAEWLLSINESPFFRCRVCHLLFNKDPLQVDICYSCKREENPNHGG